MKKETILNHLKNTGPMQVGHEVGIPAITVKGKIPKTVKVDYWTFKFVGTETIKHDIDDRIVKVKRYYYKRIK